jgi:hypothetical protein
VDDLVVYMAHRLFSVANGLVQSACTSLNVFFSSMGLRISAQSWRLCFLLRNTKILCAASDVMFQIFGNFFRCWVVMELHAAKMPPKSEFSIGDSLDPSCNMAQFVLRIWQGNTCWD